MITVIIPSAIRIFEPLSVPKNVINLHFEKNQSIKSCALHNDKCYSIMIKFYFSACSLKMSYKTGKGKRSSNNLKFQVLRSYFNTIVFYFPNLSVSLDVICSDYQSPDSMVLYLPEPVRISKPITDTAGRLFLKSGHYFRSQEMLLL